MGIRSKASIVNASVRQRGIRGLAELISKQYYRQKSVPETHVLGEEWDLLIILDACRYDALSGVRNSYPWLDAAILEARYSVGSNSKEWIENTFNSLPQENSEKIGYITGNPYSDVVTHTRDVEYLDEVWRYAWSDEHGTVLPAPITDRAIQAARDQVADRLIVHYMQPHFPPIAAPEVDSILDPEDFAYGEGGGIWQSMYDGDVTRDQLLKWYDQNLRQVLDSVSILLRNSSFDDVVVTADHGESFGERFIFGHPPGVSTPEIRKVPWVRTSAEDLDDHEPEEYSGEEYSKSVKERLQSLGYKQ